MAAATACTASDAFHLPMDVVKKSNGFAIDIGGSVAKVVYRDKEDWDFEEDEPKKVEGELARVRAVLFQRERLKEMTDYVKEHCHISSTEGQDTLIHSSGIGGNEFGQEIEEKLGVKLRNLPEFDTFAKSFLFLSKNMTENRFLFEVSSAAVKRTKEQVDALLKMLEDVSSSEAQMEGIDKANLEEGHSYLDSITREVSSLPYADTGTMFPCILAVLGSGIGYMRMEQDGTFSIIDGSNRAGKMFLGLGSILTGAKSYEELIEMAEHGDNSNVDIFGGDMKAGQCTDDIYTKARDDMPLFSFGKGADAKNPEDLKKDDLARSLLNMQCQDLAQLSDLTLETCGIKTVYFSGGFTNKPLVRELMTKEFLQRSLLSGQLGKREIRFIKAGSHVGALGAFLEGCT